MGRLFLSAAAEVDNGGIALLIGAELVVLAGQNGVHHDAHQSGHSQTGQADGHGAQRNLDGAGIADTNGQTHDHGGDQNVTALGEVNLILHKKRTGNFGGFDAFSSLQEPYHIV